MTIRHGFLLLAGAAVVVCFQGDALWGTAAPGDKKPAEKALAEPGKDGPKKPFVFAEDEVIQEFPAGEKMRTAWKVRYIGMNPGPGLVITGAWLKTAPEEPWLKVIENIRLSEIFVPLPWASRAPIGNFALRTMPNAPRFVRSGLLGLASGGRAWRKVSDPKFAA